MYKATKETWLWKKYEMRVKKKYVNAFAFSRKFPRETFFASKCKVSWDVKAFKYIFSTHFHVPLGYFFVFMMVSVCMHVVFKFKFNDC